MAGVAGTVGTATYSFGTADLPGVEDAIFQVKSGALVFRIDGEEPTEGFNAPEGSVWELHGKELSDFRAVREGASDAIIFVDFRS